MSAVVAAALERAGVEASELGGIAATAGPGLVGSLLVGLSFAKALAYRLGIPLVAVHHLAGHLGSAELSDPTLEPPYVGLVVSGGHTALYRIDAGAPPRLLGPTRDDAVGEAFDKVARVLGLPYPGGPAVAAAAVGGDPAAVCLPRPLRGRRGLDFSFSGLKTAVALEVARVAEWRAYGPLNEIQVNGHCNGVRVPSTTEIWGCEIWRYFSGVTIGATTENSILISYPSGQTFPGDTGVIVGAAFYV